MVMFLLYSSFVKLSLYNTILIQHTYGPHRYSKTRLKGPLEIDKTSDLIENRSLMEVKSIAKCSHWSILHAIFLTCIKQ